MVLNLNFSFSFWANLGQRGSDTDLHYLTSNSEARTAASLAPPATPALKRRSPTMPQTPPSRAHLSSTPRTPRRKRCRLDKHGSSARMTSYDDDRTITETPTSRAKDQQSLEVLIRSSSKHGAIRDTPASKAKDRESLEVLLRSSNTQGRANKANANPVKREAAFDAPKVAVLATSTLIDPFVSVATPVRSHTPGTDLASSLQASRVKLLASYFEQMDSAAGSVIASTSTSSRSQTASAETSHGEKEAGTQGSDAGDVGHEASFPSSWCSPETGEHEVGGLVVEKEVDGEEIGGEVPAAEVSGISGPENHVKSVQNACGEDETDRDGAAGEDWEEVTMEETIQGKASGVFSWWKGLGRD